MGWIIMIISRAGGDHKTPLPWGDDSNDNIFGDMVCYGYLLILMVQVIGIATGDKAPVQVIRTHSQSQVADIH
jgi:hypothetical protein